MLLRQKATGKICGPRTAPRVSRRRGRHARTWPTSAISEPKKAGVSAGVPATTNSSGSWMSNSELAARPTYRFRCSRISMASESPCRGQRQDVIDVPGDQSVLDGRSSHRVVRCHHRQATRATARAVPRLVTDAQMRNLSGSLAEPGTNSPTVDHHRSDVGSDDHQNEVVGTSARARKAIRIARPHGRCCRRSPGTGNLPRNMSMTRTFCQPAAGLSTIMPEASGPRFHRWQCPCPG